MGSTQEKNLAEARDAVRALKDETIRTFGRLSRVLFPGGPRGPVSAATLPSQNAIVEALESYERVLIAAQNAFSAERARVAEGQGRASIDEVWGME